MLNTLCHTCKYNRRPDDGTSGLKHLEGIKNLKLKYYFRRGAFCLLILCEEEYFAHLLHAAG
jgi:hypothetical protein